MDTAVSGVIYPDNNHHLRKKMDTITMNPEVGRLILGVFKSTLQAECWHRGLDLEIKDMGGWLIKSLAIKITGQEDKIAMFGDELPAILSRFEK